MTAITAGRMSRRTFGLASGTLAATGLLGARRVAAQQRTCVVGTWGGDYQLLLDEHIGQPLLGPQGITMQWDIASTDPRKNKLLAERRLPTGTMDVACLGDTDMYDVSLSGAFEELDETKVPNLANTLPALRRPYSAPHIFSGMVLVYHTEHADPTAFADLWDERYRGKVGLVDPSFVFAMIAAALGGGTPIDDLEAAKPRMLELKDLGARVYTSNEAVAQALESGEIWITPMWRARGFQWRSAGLPVADVAPAEGIVPIAFEMAVPRNAPDPQAGYAFLDAMLDPQAQVAFARAMGYVPTVNNAPLPDDLAAQLEFSAEEQERLVTPDFGYLAEAYSGLRQWWDREFLA